MPAATRIAYLGPTGTFSELAVRQLSLAKDAELLVFGAVSEVLASVVSGQAERAVVPIENSVEGGVSATADALATTPGLQIFGEYLVPVTFDLLVKKGSTLEANAVIATHPVAYAQSRSWLQQHFPQHTHIPTASTAGAAQAVAEGSDFDAAVAAPHVAGLYGLEVAGSNIGDNPNAQTRFLEVGAAGKPSARTGSDKTSVVVELPDDRPGGLLEMLEQFATRGVNLSRIESRPIGDRLGRYRFNIDAEGHIDDEAIAEALMGLHRFSPRVVYLGSYPRADKSESVHLGNNSDARYQAARDWVRALGQTGGATD
jgi:prephenate dehydratase